MAVPIIAEVSLNDYAVGTLSLTDNFSRFSFNAQYQDDPDRPVLGQWFNNRFDQQFTKKMRLHSWFSNLLPEGRLRDWVAAESKWSDDLEFGILKRLGQDLPGAVIVRQMESDGGYRPQVGYRYEDATSGPFDEQMRFSLAGVGMKFSSVRSGDRFVGPAKLGNSGSEEWIVKLPDPGIPNLCLNEFYCMSLAKRTGLNVPEVCLVDSESVDYRAAHRWMASGEMAYAIRRFDRVDGQRIHIEDFCQVGNLYPEEKYNGNFETVFNYCYRLTSDGETDLSEAVRRFVFNFLVDNCDAHQKNWSLIYPDGKGARLSPLYDVASTGVYRFMEETRIGEDLDHDLGLKFNGSRRIELVNIAGFERLKKKLDVDLDIPSLVLDYVERTCDEYSTYRTSIEYLPLVHWLDRCIYDRRASLLR